MAQRHISWHLLRMARASTRVSPRSESARKAQKTEAWHRALSESLYVAPSLTGHHEDLPNEGSQTACVSTLVARTEAPARHSGCLFAGSGDSFAPISATSSEGRCMRCTSTISGSSICP